MRQVILARVFYEPQQVWHIHNGHGNRQEKDVIRVIPGDEFSDGIAAAASSMQGWRWD